MKRGILNLAAFALLAILLSSCVGMEGGRCENGESTNYSWSKGLGLIAIEEFLNGKK